MKTKAAILVTSFAVLVFVVVGSMGGVHASSNHGSYRQLQVYSEANEVESWPVDDRVRLVQDVWHGLAVQGYEPELTEEMKAELDRRLEEMDRNPNVGLPWEEVKARVLGRLRKDCSLSQQA